MNMDAMKVAGMQFALNLMHKLSTENENLFISPQSISSALSMVLLGSKNESQKQIVHSLFAGITAEEIHQINAKIHGCLLASSKDSMTLSIANSMFPEVTYSVLPEFSSEMQSKYSVAVQPMDYIKNANNSRVQINKWVEEKTQDKIKDLLQDGVLSADTRMVIVNAVYFKADWAQKFDPKATFDSEFHLNAEATSQVKMMSRKAKFPYYEDSDMKAVELPYAGEEVSMTVVLPNEHLGLGKVLGKLTPEKLEQISKESTTHEDIVVKMPRMKIEYSTELVEPLKALGVTDIFDDKRADLSGISGARDLFVSNVVHKTFIEVNEEGSEAAAATAVLMMRMAFLPPMEFVCNQPFVFYIKHKPTGALLFLAKICKV